MGGLEGPRPSNGVQGSDLRSESEAPLHLPPSPIPGEGGRRRGGAAPCPAGGPWAPDSVKTQKIEMVTLYIAVLNRRIKHTALYMEITMTFDTVWPPGPPVRRGRRLLICKTILQIRRTILLNSRCILLISRTILLNTRTILLNTWFILLNTWCILLNTWFNLGAPRSFHKKRLPVAGEPLVWCCGPVKVVSSRS
jgi:hypothetical protein